MAPGLTILPGSTNGSPSGKEGYVVDEKPIHQRRKLRLICIGAGICGIAAAYKYQRELENVEFQIYEKNHDVGGTWLENRYPGCACDIPAHGYTYSWEGNPEWSRFYVEAPEIFDYYKGCAQKWNCMQYIKLNSKVVEARWSESRLGWCIKLENTVTGETFEDFCDVLLGATGTLNKWNWPNIEGLHSFKGKLLHSAKWDDEYDFKDKTIAVIGAGSSGIQIVPNLQPLVKHMVTFIRSPTWITPEFSESLAVNGRDTTFTPEEIERFKTDKKYFLEYRKLVQNTGSATYSLYFKGSDRQKAAYEAFRKLMRERLGGDEELCQKIIPEFEVGCRRFTPGHGYLEALTASNVNVVTNGVAKVTETGIVADDGTEYKIDALVCATGFACDFRPAFPLIGRNGVDLADAWKSGPKAYMSVTTTGFPNYFMTGGPNSPIANGSLIAALETEIAYCFKCIKLMQTEDIATLEISEEAVDDFIEHRDTLMKKMVWSGGCRSWYKSGTIDGPVVGPWVGSTWHFNAALERIRLEDYNIRYVKKNRFSYMGHGWTKAQMDGDDVCGHMREPGA